MSPSESSWGGLGLGMAALGMADGVNRKAGMEDFIGTPEEYNSVRFGIKEPYCGICNQMIEEGQEWEEDYGHQFHSECLDERCNA